MILTERKIPKNLLYYRALQHRLDLDKNAQKKKDALERGYEGELLYDSFCDEIIPHLYIFRDIYLKIEDNTLQCDALIVSNDGFIVNEIKNYRGIYTYENEKWYVRNKEISEDPVSQLKRTTNKLVKFDYMYNQNFNSEGKIIFPNPEFSLETNHPTVLDYTIARHQLRRYLNGMYGLKSSKRADELVEIIQKHIIDDPYFDLSANFETLIKGVYCRRCGGFNADKILFHFECKSCGHKDTMHTVILQALSDYNILFNNEHINRQLLWKFLGGQVAHSTLNKYLNKYCIQINKGPATRYKFKYYDFDDALKNEIRLWRYKDMPLKNAVDSVILKNL